MKNSKKAVLLTNEKTYEKFRFTRLEVLIYCLTFQSHFGKHIYNCYTNYKVLNQKNSRKYKFKYLQ